MTTSSNMRRSSDGSNAHRFLNEGVYLGLPMRPQVWIHRQRALDKPGLAAMAALAAAGRIVLVLSLHSRCGFRGTRRRRTAR